MADWAVADAKNRFSELITKALTEGPQRVTRRGEEVVVVSATEFDKLKQPKDFIAHLLSFPGFGDPELDLSRDSSSGRDISFDDPA